MRTAYTAAAIVGASLGALVLLLLALTLCVDPAAAAGRWEVATMAVLLLTLGGRVLYLEALPR